MQYHPATVQTSTSTRLGTVRLAASPQGLVGLWFDGQRHQPAQLYGPHAWPQDLHHPVLVAAIEQLHQYLRGERTGFELPLDLAGGTPFQQSVWHALLGIGAGDSQSYGQVAARIGHPAAVRAVGTAVGANPVSVIVPCHRVLGSTGTLAGYGGGLGRKVALLRREGWQVEAPAAGAEPAPTLRPQRVAVRR